MKLNIFGLDYKLLKVNELETGGVANLNYQTRTMKVLKTMKGQRYDECVIHEMVHAVFDRIGVGSTKLHPDFEEIICDSVAKVVSENFKLVPR